MNTPLDIKALAAAAALVGAATLGGFWGWAVAFFYNRFANHVPPKAR